MKSRQTSAGLKRLEIRPSRKIGFAHETGGGGENVKLVINHLPANSSIKTNGLMVWNQQPVGNFARCLLASKTKTKFEDKRRCDAFTLGENPNKFAFIKNLKTDLKTIK